MCGLESASIGDRDILAVIVGNNVPGTVLKEVPSWFLRNGKEGGSRRLIGNCCLNMIKNETPVVVAKEGRKGQSDAKRNCNHIGRDE